MNNPSQQILTDRLLRASEVAEILNISESLAYRLMQQGEIRVVRFNRSVRVRQEDLEEFILQNTAEEPTPYFL